MKSKPRVLMVLSGSYIYGSELSTLSLLNYGRKYFDFHVLLSGWNDGKFIRELENLDLPYTTAKIGWLHLSKPLWLLDTLINLPKAYFKVLRLVLSTHFDVKHFTGFKLLIMLFPIIKGPVFLHQREDIEKNILNTLSFKFLALRGVHFLVPSRHIFNRLTSIIGNDSNTDLIYNGIDFSKGMGRSFTPSDKVNLLYVGQIAPHKGLDVLFRALKGLNFNWELNIYGTGNKTYINHLIKVSVQNGFDESINWNGYESDLDVIYGNSDLLLLTTLENEPFGRVILEASRYRIPCVSSNLGGPTEIIVHNDTGCFFETGDYFSLQSVLNVLCCSKENVYRLGLKAYNRNRLMFDVHNTVKRFVEILKKELCVE